VVAGLDHSHTVLRTCTARVFTPAYNLVLWSLITGTSVQFLYVFAVIKWWLVITVIFPATLFSCH